MPAPSRFQELTNVPPEARAPSALGHSADTHRWARQVLIKAWDRIFPGDTPSLEELQAIQALAAHDGQYGRGWPDKISPVSGLPTSMSACNNWGAIQCTCKAVDGVCCDGCGYWYDSTPTPEGQRYFEQCFRCYATPEDGAADVIRFLAKGYAKVMEALPTGNLDEIAWQMRLGNYFHGFTTDKREAARQYAEAMRKQAVAIAAAMGEPLVADRKGEGVLGVASQVPWVPIAAGFAVGALGLAFVAPSMVLAPLVLLGDGVRSVTEGARKVARKVL
jgi:hypothetical protein